MRLAMYQWIYLVLLALGIASLVGWLRIKAWQEMNSPQRAMAIGLTVMTLGVLAGFIRFNMTFFEAQGRYLFPALIPIGLLFVGGLSALVTRRDINEPVPISSRPQPVVLAITAGLAILNVYCILWIHWFFPPVW
jgi:hypothetical protein